MVPQTMQLILGSNLALMFVACDASSSCHFLYYILPNKGNPFPPNNKTRIKIQSLYVVFAFAASPMGMRAMCGDVICLCLPTALVSPAPPLS